MVEEVRLTQGGVYLAKLDPAKSSEVGKIRPVVVLTAPIILDVQPDIIFVCPLSSKSYPEFSALHVELAPRDNLQKISFALVEHCRSISFGRLALPRLAQLTEKEIATILMRLQRMVGL
ncbi:MAG: MazF family transcriptional regulator [Gammaproteobacteria bacterium RIFCSPHIGHO2_12_FULL_45_9]|nr:MAG: MazF family transcriptional regulator [Gammaproteobacteria bacterium RIFCSPHIGHO2_12_FULL_45_9]